MLHGKDQGSVELAPREQVRGAVFSPEHLDTKEKVYPIPESRLTTLSLLNGLVPFFFSLATGALTFGLGIEVNLAMCAPSAEAQKFAGVLCWVCYVASVVFFIAAGWFLYLRASDLKRLKDSAYPARASGD
ncbi:MAG: hypothetical protein V1790_19240 [Planctomycetota bacterium]